MRSAKPELLVFVMDQGTFLLAHDYSAQGTGLIHVEDADWQVVITSQGKGGQVHDLELFFQHIVVIQLVYNSASGFLTGSSE